MRRVELRQEWRQDATYAWRQLRRNPAFTAIALVTLALGIGANTAIFSVVESVLLRPLPYRNAGQVVTVWSASGVGTPGGWAMAAPEFADIQDQARVFNGASAIFRQSAAITGGCPGACEPDRVMGYWVSPNTFDVLGVAPARGRGFGKADGQEGSPLVTILSHGLWMRRYGGDSAIVGRDILVNGTQRQVIGVMPPGVRFPDAPVGFLKEPGDIWVPYAWERARSGSRGNQNLAMIARVRPGVSPAAVQADLDVIAARFRQQFPDRYAIAALAWHLTALSLRDQMVGDVRLGLLVLAATVGLVLLIACVNVANLLLARGAVRRKELAVRAALGAGRGRIVRQLLTESMVLALAGGVLGIGLAWLGVRGLVALDPGRLPFLADARLNGTVLGYSFGLALVTGFLFGLAPALQQWRSDPHDALQEGGRGSRADARGRLRQVLVVAEIAMALVVLTGAGLLIRSFAALERVPTGFDSHDVTTLQLSVSGPRYDSAYKRTAFTKALAAGFEAIPGVERASAVYPLPMAEEGWSGSFYVEGQTIQPGTAEPHAEYAVSMPGYFGVLGIPLRAGRDFTLADDAGAPPVVVVDETLARRYWPGQETIGKRLNPNRGPGQFATIIGVVAHVHNAGPQFEGEPQVYVPYLQDPQGPLFPVARARPGVQVSAAAFRNAVRQLNPELPIARLKSMDEVVAHAFARQRFNMVLLTVFGSIALVLASIGLYGVLSFVVAQRSHEIGIRLALGGRPMDVVRMVVGQGLLLAVVGLSIGLLATAATARVLSTLLFGVGTTDAFTYVTVSALLLVVALVAAYVPARRATRVDPLTAMRDSA